jgi:MarR family transcriptional regulator, temperature-dependent positive regulator of motility
VISTVASTTLIREQHQPKRVPETFSLPSDMPLGAYVSILNKTHLIIINERLKHLGVSSGQLPVMMYLMRKQNVMQEALVRHFHIDKGSIARSVKKLEDTGFIRRITDPDNRRAVRLFLTEKGEQVAPEIMRIDREWEELSYAGLSDDEREQFSALILRILKNNLEDVHNLGVCTCADE